jgi:hypothetical protein
LYFLFLRAATKDELNRYFDKPEFSLNLPFT